MVERHRDDAARYARAKHFDLQRRSRGGQLDRKAARFAQTARSHFHSRSEYRLSNPFRSPPDTGESCLQDDGYRQRGQYEQARQGLRKESGFRNTPGSASDNTFRSWLQRSLCRNQELGARNEFQRLRNHGNLYGKVIFLSI